MNNKDMKIPIIALSILSVLLFYSTIVLFVIKNHEAERANNFKKRFEEVTAMKQDLEVRQKELELTGAEMRANIKSQEERVTALSKSLDDEKAAHFRTNAKMEESLAETSRLKAKLEEEKADKEDLLKRLDKLNENYLNIKFQLENLIKTKEELEKRAKDLADKEGVSLGTIVIRQ